jgi:hypothetical protein
MEALEDLDEITLKYFLETVIKNDAVSFFFFSLDLLTKEICSFNRNTV